MIYDMGGQEGETADQRTTTGRSTLWDEGQKLNVFVRRI